MHNTIVNDFDLNKRYKDDLDKASLNMENRLVLNDGAIKASILIETLISNAKESIYIYSKMLNNDVTSITKKETGLDTNFLTSFEKVLSNKDIEVKIILNEHTNNLNLKNLLEIYCAKNNEFNNELKLLDNTFILEMFNKDFHFIVIDETGYRFEHDINNYRADANFCNPKMAKGLKQLFNYLYLK